MAPLSGTGFIAFRCPAAWGGRGKARRSSRRTWTFLSALTWRLRALRSQAHWERRDLHYRLGEASRQVSPSGALSADWAERLGLEVLAISSHPPQLFKWLRQLNRRLERLCRVLLRKRSGGEPLFGFFTRPRLSEETLAGQPGPVLNNPFLSPRRVAQALEEKPVRLKGVELGVGERPARDPDPFALPSEGKALGSGGRPGAQMGEDFAAHLRGFEGLFPGAEEPGRTLVREVAEVSWGRLGVFGGSRNKK